MNTFYKDLERGKIGEEIARSFYERCGYTVTSLTDNPLYWSMDVDFLVEEGYGDKIYYVEVKTDWNTARTLNLCIEIDERGWLQKTCSDEICYVSMGDNIILYFIDTEELKRYIGEFKKETDEILKEHEGLIPTPEESKNIITKLRKACEKYGATFKQIDGKTCALVNVLKSGGKLRKEVVKL